MITNFNEFRNKFAELVIGWWGYGDGANMQEDDFKTFIFLRMLANENKNLDSILKKMEGEGWTERSEEIINEICDFGIQISKKVKSELIRNPNIKYKDIKELFDNFITVYSIESMIAYRWGGFYMGYNDEIVFIEDIRRFLSKEYNRPNLIFKWNYLVSDKNAKILTFGNEATFNFIKTKIDDLYSETGVFRAKYSSELLQLVFDKKQNTECIDIFSELLVEINNLLHFEQTAYLDRLLEVRFPSDLDRHGDGNPSSIYQVNNTSYAFHLFQNLWLKTSEPNYQYKIIFVTDNFTKEQDHNSYIMKNNHIFYNLIQRSEYNYWSEKTWMVKQEFDNAIEKALENYLPHNWNLLCYKLECNSLNLNWFEKRNSQFLIRHKNKVSYNESDQDIAELLKQSGNYNIKYAIKTR